MVRQGQKDANGQPAIFYCSDAEQSITSIDRLVQQIKADTQVSTAKEAVCVIENISAASTDSLLRGLDLDPTLFDSFGVTVAKESFWKQRYLWDWTPPPSAASYGNLRQYMDVAHEHLFVDGMFEYHGLERRPGGSLTTEPNFSKRECFEEDAWPIQSTTRVSYFRLFHSLRKWSNCITDSETRLTVKRQISS